MAPPDGLAVVGLSLPADIMGGLPAEELEMVRFMTGAALLVVLDVAEAGEAGPEASRFVG